MWCSLCPVGCGCTVDGRDGEAEDYGGRALSSVMAPCLSGLSLITGCDGIHQRVPTEWETIISLSVCLLICQTDSESICPFVKSHFYTCAGFQAGLIRTGRYCDIQVGQGKVPAQHYKYSGSDSLLAVPLGACVPVNTTDHVHRWDSDLVAAEVTYTYTPNFHSRKHSLPVTLNGGYWNFVTCSIFVDGCCVHSRACTDEFQWRTRASAKKRF